MLDWNTDDLKWATQVDEGFKLHLRFLDPSHLSSPDDKWEIMNIGEHLQTSVMAGLIDKYRGASNFLNDKTT